MEDNNDVLTNGDPSGLPDHPPTKPSQSDAVSDLKAKLVSLESQNEQSLSKISELNDAVSTLTVERDSESKAAAAIAKRASELEGEVARLQHDLISSMSESETLTAETHQLQTKVAELEAKLRASESEKAELNRQKKLAEESVGKLEAMLEDSKEKVRAMGEKMVELMKRSEESEKAVDGLLLRQKNREMEDGAQEKTAAAARVRVLKEKLPVIGAVSGAAVIVAAMAVCYFRYRRN